MEYRMKNNPAKVSVASSVADLSEIGVDVTPSRHETVRKAYFFRPIQARQERRIVPIEWWETGAQVIECQRGAGEGSPLELLVFSKTRH